MWPITVVVTIHMITIYIKWDVETVHSYKFKIFDLASYVFSKKMWKVKNLTIISPSSEMKTKN